MRFRLLALSSVVALVATSSPLAQENVDRDIYWKIRREATDNSQLMKTLQVLTDLYGPRLTGSPNLKGASDWVVKETTAWGLKNAHLEPWDFGHPGWLNERLSVHVVSPVKDALVAEALAWTPGTNGPVTAQITPLELPEQPTKESLATFLDGRRAAVKGKVVMVNAPNQCPSPSTRPPSGARMPTCARSSPAPGGPAGPFGPPQPPQAADKSILTANQVNEQLDQFLVAAGAVARVNDAGREHGQIRAFNNRTFDVAKAVPTVVMRNEDYGRLWRLMAAAARWSSS
jgi:carboxypeptidase Q